LIDSRRIWKYYQGEMLWRQINSGFNCDHSGIVAGVDTDLCGAFAGVYTYRVFIAYKIVKKNEKLKYNIELPGLVEKN